MSKADQALRARALELAQGNLNSTTPTGAIIERAKAYLAFLSPAKPVKAKAKSRRPRRKMWRPIGQSLGD